MTSFNRFFKAQTWDKVTASIIGLSWLITVYQTEELFRYLLSFVFAKFPMLDLVNVCLSVATRILK